MKRAILFLNLGGPETLAEVKPFLYRLFVDPEIIRIPFKRLRMLVAWFISTWREEKSKALYAQIGGGSPIRRLTDAQSAAVERLLKNDGHAVMVRTAFTCSAPLVEDVVQELYRAGVQKFLSFPLYPQYSFTTTKGSLERVRAAVDDYAPGAGLSEIVCFPTHPLFLKAHADQIIETLERFSSDENLHLVFSAHSIPQKLVDELGDPYKKQMEQTVAGVLEVLQWTGPHTLAWQSKLGPVKWLGPSTKSVLESLGAQGGQRALVIPIAFVTDHIETLQEIDLELKEDALRAGVVEFQRTSGLNNHPLFMQALADLATHQDDFWTESLTVSPTATPST